METIDEFEAQGDQQRQAQQKKRGDRGNHGAAGADVLLETPGGVGDAGHEQAEEQKKRGAPGFVRKLRAGIAVDQ
ncbi:hypothetical protein D3C76_1758680 [compost metagenome]